MNTLNNIKNNKLIKISNNCDFVFIEEPLKLDSPVSNYYFKYSDLSINLNINLKWALYAFFFLNSILENVNDTQYNEGVSFKDSINSVFVI